MNTNQRSTGIAGILAKTVAMSPRGKLLAPEAWASLAGGMDKDQLLAQLESELRSVAHEAHNASAAAAEEAKAGATAREKRSDSRVMIEQANLSRGQGRRAARAFGELRALTGFKPGPLAKGAAVQVGAIVEIEDEDSGEGRTFFLAPAGAGISLSGPGGDGVLSVVTPISPIGRAVLGCRRGDVIDVTVKGDVREWQITWVE